MSFFPENYELPSTGGDTGLYMKIQDGENKIRIMDKPLLGFVYWSEDNTPRRIRRRINNPYNMRSNGKFGPERLRHFWSLIVWDYINQSVRILEITQATVQQQIMSLVNDTDWGDPTGYNLKILKQGEKTDTTYTVIPSPSATIPPQAIASLEETPINLNALYFNGKPNDPNWKEEARSTVYKWIGDLYAEAPKRGIDAQAMDFDNASLSDCLAFYENLLEEISKTPVMVNTNTAPSSPSTVAASADEIPF